MNSLPSRFSEKAFRRYEALIKNAVEAWPEGIVVQPDGPVQSVETLSCRLRDAMRSLSENDWTTRINKEKFKQVYAKAIVAIVEQGVYVGPPRDKITGEPGVSKEVKATITAPTAIHVTTDVEDLLHSLIVLHHYSLLLEPSTITTTLDMTKATKNYDVSFSQNEQGQYILF